MKNLSKSQVLFISSIIALTFSATFPAEAQPIINEIMASNTSSYQDEDGESPDWIEIYNPGDTSIDLTGYGLSDRPDNPYKWVFPAVFIEPKEHLIVFASGKNRKIISGHWETIINHGDEWRYFVGTSEPPADWNSVDFNDSGWLSGSSSIGSLESDATNILQTTSIFIRKKFNVDDIENITQCILQIDYQDAFVAYLNGQKIARANIEGVSLAYDKKPSTMRNMEIIKGGNPDVYNISDLPELLLNGENVLAIQVHSGKASLPGLIRNISIIPFLTLELSIPPSNPSGIPEILNFSIPEPSLLHTNFKISSDGETLVLTDPDGALCDSVYTEIDGTDLSINRKTDGGEEWVLSVEPTPGKANTSEGYQGYTDVVVEMSPDGGFYDSAIMLELFSDSVDSEIRYTIDGSNPSETSMLYVSAISIDTTTVVRARIFEGTFLPGPIITQTYFINEETTLPVISLSTNPDNFFDDDIGIYVNANEDWERPIHIEFYELNGSRGFSIDGGVKISGYIIKDFAQKPLALFARNKYGYNKIDYKIFPDMPITEFKSVTLRNGGNEYGGNTRFRDVLCHNLGKNTNIDIMAFRPAKVFINGDYWGHYNIREKQNEDYLAAHHSIDPDNVDMLEYVDDIQVIEGDSLHYKAMIDFIENNDMNDSAHYEYIKTQMEIDNYIDYNVAEMYLANFNWTRHNVKFWRPRTPKGRWRWMLCDLDFGLSLPQVKLFGQNPFSPGLIGNQYLDLLFNLLDNNEFRHMFLNRFGDHINTIYTPENVIQKMNEIKELLEPEMPDYITRWKDSAEITTEIIESMEDWNSNIAIIEEFAEQRPGSLQNHIIEYFNLSGTANVSLAVSSPEAGTIKLNSIIPDEFPWSGIYFKDVPVQLTALPNLGYRFVGWSGAELGDSISSTITLTDSISVTAVFEKVAANSMVIDSSQSPYRIAGIQSVAAGSSLSIEAGVELLMSANSSINVSGEIHLNGTPENPIQISAEGGQNWNSIFLDNASGNSTISHVVISGASTWDNPEDSPAAISGLNSDVTIDNVRFENCRQSIFAEGGSVIVKNCFFNESNTHEPINIKNASAVVENCRFENVFFEDAIDYDGITDGIIRDNEIFGTVDSDGDGIDIGDDCVNVLITGNLIYDCTDKGISIGEGAKDIRVEKNIIAGCLYGIAVKDSATAFIDHCTIHGNDYAIAAYEKGERRFGGGTAVVTNSILAKSNISTLFTDELSEITVSYTLSDSELPNGNSNLMADPMLAVPECRIFDLMPNSPALTADNDGAELGALPYRELVSDVVINEINYNSSEDFNSGDWVELYNITENTIDISGWVFKDDDDTHSFELPSNTVLEPYAYVVLCCDDSLFTNEFPEVNRVVGSFGFGLNAAGEALRLYDAYGGLVDWVVYDDAEPWPIESDGTGSTLALVNPEEDNIHAANWASSAGNGTPGWVNDVANGIDETYESDSPIAFSLGQNYPNPFNPVTTIPFSVPESGRVTLKIYSITGQRVVNVIDGVLPAGSHQAVFKAEHLPSGMYFYRIEAEGYKETKSMLLLK
ncbi:CotH kinase family protein [Candidatus Latescibacterota bacterium]